MFDDKDKFERHLSWDQQQKFDSMPEDEQQNYMKGYYSGGHDFDNFGQSDNNTNVDNFGADRLNNHEQNYFNHQMDYNRDTYMNGYHAGSHDFQQNGDYDGFFSGNHDPYGTHGDFDDGSHGDYDTHGNYDGDDWSDGDF